MLPSIFGENLFDDFFTDPFGMMVMPQRHDPLYGKHSKNLMKTDVRETEDSYELDVDLPGFKKDEVNVELKNGYLTIQAAKGLDKDETDKKGKYIRQELDKAEILAYRKDDYQWNVLVADKEKARRKYKNAVVDDATIDDILLLYVKGEQAK